MQTFHLPDLAADLCYHDLPGGAPVWVYLHGLGSASSADFPAIARQPRLAPYRALLIDLLGFGYSDRPENFSHTLEAHAATVANLFEHLGLQGCHLVGHSFGGSVAIALAAARPDLIGSLVVAEPNLEPEDATLSRMIVAQTEEDYVASGHADLITQAEAWAADGDAPAIYARTLRAADPRAMHRSATALVAASLGETFFNLRLPRAYLFGELTLPHHHEALLGANGVPMAVVPGVGHAMMEADLDDVAGILAETMP